MSQSKNDIYKEIDDLAKEILEGIDLPNIDSSFYLKKNVECRGHEYEITFYKVSRNNGESYFWTYNPFNVVSIRN
ncbi:MAG: hypothetical protein ACRYFB_08975 [Janthinobacterium lividum]